MAGLPVVIDASIALKVVLPDPLREQCHDALSRLVSTGFEFVAPTLWAYETTSILCKAVHFKWLTPDEGRRTLVQLGELGVRLVSLDPAKNRQAFEWTLRLGRAAAYDSYYLALAQALKCDLWTADLRLFNAVNLPWVHCVGNDQRDST